uniref:Uncharacterized protein n=1 Tax=Sipha flava TaxID=143950 RepID=A0A2S2R3L4_9HEMI
MFSPSYIRVAQLTSVKVSVAKLGLKRSLKIDRWTKLPIVERTKKHRKHVKSRTDRTPERQDRRDVRCTIIIVHPALIDGRCRLDSDRCSWLSGSVRAAFRL